MSRILVATTSQTGHVLPVLSLLPALREAGHDITFITGSRWAEKLRDKGIRHIPLTGKADYDAADVNVTFPERRNAVPGPDFLDYDFRTLFIEPMADQARAIQGALAEGPAVLICNHMFAGGWPFRLGMPGPKPLAVIALGITPLMSSDPSLAPFGAGLPPATGAERARYAGMQRALDDGPLRPSHLLLNRELRALGAEISPHPFMDATTFLPDHFLQLSVPGLEYPRQHVPRDLRMIGSAPVVPQAFTPPAWWPEVVAARAAGRPVIFVTQGTVARDLDKLLRPTLAALAGMDALVVATAGKMNDAMSEGLPANARMTDYLPYERILPLADLVVTNGGYGGVQQALCHGVPLVLAGLSEDKAEVAARVEWAGAGINLRTDRPSVEQIASAVRRGLQDVALKAGAAALSREYRALDPARELAGVVGEVLARARKPGEQEQRANRPVLQAVSL
ncbi:glycosyltransferase [Falsirhodobacter sp. 20TX0035]|uniref:glycosyltransferase n=1 Tax=Falsirhodobacter sp. 20TX0035 TaxID=3022019 RepID=UPI00233066B3|nr:nucleotide disphospho-sugar-binding domain-containing protein [Falsirhodobacter sp. 20TX0035]MDB6454283.1 glycosyltransferase [Falsirhodobacter sp. 20TX0035]